MGIKISHYVSIIYQSRLFIKNYFNDRAFKDWTYRLFNNVLLYIMAFHLNMQIWLPFFLIKNTEKYYYFFVVTSSFFANQCR